MAIVLKQNSMFSEQETVANPAVIHGVCHDKTLNQQCIAHSLAQ